MAARDSLGDLGPRRVEERDEPEQAELVLGVLAPLGGGSVRTAGAGAATASTRRPCGA